MVINNRHSLTICRGHAGTLCASVGIGEGGPPERDSQAPPLTALKRADHSEGNLVAHIYLNGNHSGGCITLPMMTSSPETRVPGGAMPSASSLS